MLTPLNSIRYAGMAKPECQGCLILAKLTPGFYTPME